jgi:uncharacterized membrane protein YeiH
MIARDEQHVLIGQVPTLLRSELYAIPALLAAAVTAATSRAGVYGVPAAVAAAALCFGVRMLGVRFGWNAPGPPGARGEPGAAGTPRG